MEVMLDLKSSSTNIVLLFDSLIDPCLTHASSSKSLVPQRGTSFDDF